MNSMEFEQIRNNAMNKFNKLSQERIFCPALNLKIKFTNELNNVAEKNEIYSDFSELILNQIQNLINKYQ